MGRDDELDVVGLILFGSGVALLSYVLEIFGEHTLSAGGMAGLLALSVALLAGYIRDAFGKQFVPHFDLTVVSFAALKVSVLRKNCRETYRTKIVQPTRHCGYFGLSRPT